MSRRDGPDDTPGAKVPRAWETAQRLRRDAAANDDAPKEDGLPAFYCPDFLVRTAAGIYLVETKEQQQTMHPKVQRKLRAAVAWCERINGLAPEHRQGLPWHYVLLGEDAVQEWQGQGAHLAELLDFARLRPLASADLQASLL